jgi:hypothetical protein
MTSARLMKATNGQIAGSIKHPRGAALQVRRCAAIQNHWLKLIVDGQTRTVRLPKANRVHDCRAPLEFPQRATPKQIARGTGNARKPSNPKDGRGAAA